MSVNEFLSIGAVSEQLQRSPTKVMELAEKIGVEPTMKLDNVIYFNADDVEKLHEGAAIDGGVLDESTDESIGLQALISKHLKEGPLGFTVEKMSISTARALASMCNRGAITLILDESTGRALAKRKKQPAAEVAE